jgi:hypothetical protein
MRKLAGWLVIAGVLVVPVVVAEVWLRHVGLGHPVLYYENPAYGYAARPNQMVGRLRNATVTIDSVGLRSTVDWTQPADLKILFLGDSVTYGGSYIDDRDLFSERVCVLLAERLQRTFNCGNAGANAYGLDNMTGRLRYKEFDDEDVIVLVVISGDAERGFVTLQSLPYFAKSPPRPIPASTELFAFAIDRLRYLIRFSDAPLGGADRTLELANESLDRLLDALRGEQGENKMILLVHSPDRNEVQNGYHGLDKLVVERLRDSGFEFIEMREALVGMDLEAVYYDNVHLEARGHEIYGEVIADRVAMMLLSGHRLGAEKE